MPPCACHKAHADTKRADYAPALRDRGHSRCRGLLTAAAIVHSSYHTTQTAILHSYSSYQTTDIQLFYSLLLDGGQRVGLHTILPSQILYGVWHKKGVLVGGRIPRNGRAIVLQ